MCNLSAWRKSFSKTRDYKLSFGTKEYVSTGGGVANFLNKPPTETGPRTMMTSLKIPLYIMSSVVADPVVNKQ